MYNFIIVIIILLLLFDNNCTCIELTFNFNSFIIILSVISIFIQQHFLTKTTHKVSTKLNGTKHVNRKINTKTFFRVIKKDKITIRKIHRIKVRTIK